MVCLTLWDTIQAPGFILQLHLFMKHPRVYPFGPSLTQNSVRVLLWGQSLLSLPSLTNLQESAGVGEGEEALNPLINKRQL